MVRLDRFSRQVQRRRAPVHLAGFLELLLIVQRDAQQGEGSAVIGSGFHFRPEGSFGGREIAALQSRQRLPNRRSIIRCETDGQSQRHGAIPEDSIHGSATGYSTPDSRPPSMQICQTSPDAWRSDRIQVTKYPLRRRRKWLSTSPLLIESKSLVEIYGFCLLYTSPSPRD